MRISLGWTVVSEVINQTIVSKSSAHGVFQDQRLLNDDGFGTGVDPRLGGAQCAAVDAEAEDAEGTDLGPLQDDIVARQDASLAAAQDTRLIDLSLERLG
jgi:hypothetical protein